MKSKLIVLLTCLVICFFSSLIKVRADEPLAPPTDYWISSQNNKFKAFLDVKKKVTSVYKVEKIKGKEKKDKIWEMDGWFRNTFLSNDGENLIVAYNGANLLELDFKPDQVMLSFYHQGKLLNEVRLNQLIENPIPENLEKTVSHYKWVSTYGLNDKQVFEVNTIAKKQFLFDIKTGLPIGTALYSADLKLDQHSESGNINQNDTSKESNNSSSNNSNVIGKSKRVNNCQFAFFFIAGLAGLLNKLTPRMRQVYKN